ncbi:MAG: hypothetical protein Kow0098_21030 [Ignavibacteriaceae bacterium]
MSGKASLLLVIGFSMIFMAKATKLLEFSNSAVDNYVQYYSESIAHNIAVAGANMASNELFFNKYWTKGYSNLDFSGGKLDVQIQTIGADNRKIISIGDFNGISDSVIVTLQPKNFAQYGNFYNSMAAWAATGDTFSGPFHTNDFLKCYGDPVFLGYTTTRKGLMKYKPWMNPEFQGGFESGVYIPLEFDTSEIRQAAYSGGYIFKDNSKKQKVIDVSLVFNEDGTVTYKQKTGKKWSSEQTVPLTDLAPNGVIYVEKGNIYVEGTLSGQATIVASRKGSSAGMVHITDDIVYKNNPLTNPNSTDMLGIVAERNVQVDFNPSTGDLDIHASIYSQADGLVIENYQKYPSANNMNIIGGVIGEKVQPTAEYVWKNGKLVAVAGYRYVHKFDERFYSFVPPFFPKTKYYKVVSWLE